MEIDLEKYKTCRMCEECDPEYAFCCKPLIAYIERLEAVVETAEAFVNDNANPKKYEDLRQALQAVAEGE